MTDTANKWSRLLTDDELAAYWARFREHDPHMARACEKEWEALSDGELSVREYQAWLCNDADDYQLARTYRRRLADARPTEWAFAMHDRERGRPTVFVCTWQPERRRNAITGEIFYGACQTVIDRRVYDSEEVAEIEAAKINGSRDRHELRRAAREAAERRAARLTAAMRL